MSSEYIEKNSEMLLQLYHKRSLMSSEYIEKKSP